MTLFERTKKIAKRKGYSIAELERKANLSENYLYTWKRTDNPRTDSLEKVAKALNVTVDYLLGKNETPAWANEKDTHDLEEFLNNNEGSMTYGGEDLTQEEKEKLKIAMTQIFWDRHKHN